MGMEDEVNRAMSEAGQRMEGFIPGLSEKIDELRFQQYGRAIGIGNTEDPLSQTKTIGYILPLNENQDHHLVLFKNGIIFTTRPNDLNQSQVYNKHFKPSEADEIFNQRFYSLSTVLAQYLNSHFAESVIEFKNDDPLCKLQIQEAIVQAIRLAHSLKEKREAVKQETVSILMEEIDGLLRS